MYDVSIKITSGSYRLCCSLNVCNDFVTNNIHGALAHIVVKCCTMWEMFYKLCVVNSTANMFSYR